MLPIPTAVAWHTLEETEALHTMISEISIRQHHCGPNTLSTKAKVPTWKRFLLPFNQSLCYILMIAGTMKAFTKILAKCSGDLGGGADQWRSQLLGQGRGTCGRDWGSQRGCPRHRNSHHRDPRLDSIPFESLLGLTINFLGGGLPTASIRTGIPSNPHPKQKGHLPPSAEPNG